MRAVAMALAVLAVVTVAPVARATEAPEAQMLLDLDLLRESDPRVQREEPVARNVRLLELLERLNPPAAARRGGDSRPAPKGAC
jgi:hypothetical protein